MTLSDIPEKEWYIEAPWGKICIIAWGDCTDPPVLLCHGSMDSAACFRPLVKLLPRRFYYIAMEFPGNGKSDPFPPGLMVSCYDLVFPIALVVRHFRWDQFIMVAHSLGTIIGKLYVLSHPGKVSRVVNFDPLPTWLTMPADVISHWYHVQFTKYYENFESYNSPKEKGPQYKWEEAIAVLKKNRGLTESTAAATLERIAEPVGDGFIRYTFDQRMKLISRPPFSPEALEKVFTSIHIPTLSLIAEDSFMKGRYERTPFKLDEGAYPHGNYRVRRVEGGHDLHFTNPERVAGYVTQFLLNGLEGIDSKAKL